MPTFQTPFNQAQLPHRASASQKNNDDCNSRLNNNELFTLQDVKNITLELFIKL